MHLLKARLVPAFRRECLHGMDFLKSHALEVVDGYCQYDIDGGAFS